MRTLIAAALVLFASLAAAYDNIWWWDPMPTTYADGTAKSAGDSFSSRVYLYSGGTYSFLASVPSTTATYTMTVNVPPNSPPQTRCIAVTAVSSVSNLESVKSAYNCKDFFGASLAPAGMTNLR